MTPKHEAQIAQRVEQALKAIRLGGMVILTDDEDRENEGDLVMAAEKATPAAINFMAKEGRGLICLSLTEAKVKQLNLPLMVTDNTSSFQTAFTVSIEAASGVTTGISAADRATTIAAAIAPKAKPSHLARPGHIFPLRARDGGVLVRPGQTEGSVDLARMAGLSPCGVICEIMKDDGTMARRPDLLKFAKKHRMPMLSVSDIIHYRLAHERLVKRVGDVTFERNPFGHFRACAYTSEVSSAVHVALIKGDLNGKKPVLARIHRTTVLGDMLDACSGEGALKKAFERVVAEGSGIIILLQQQVAGEQALNLKPPSNEQAVPGHSGQTRLKEFGIGAQILKDLNVTRIRLLTRTPNQIIGAEAYGIEVAGQIQLDDVITKKPRRR
jgi:3,4-dihydroxy 2-butanone 4-phosphate synthase / GTP cyclohydrolase II